MDGIKKCKKADEQNENLRAPFASLPVRIWSYLDNQSKAAKTGLKRNNLMFLEIPYFIMSEEPK
jgi:hypothetical protein